METIVIVFFTILLIILTPFALMMLFVSVIMTVSFIRMPFEYMKIKRIEYKNKQSHFKPTHAATKVRPDEPRPETFMNGTNRRPVKPPSR